MVNSQEPGSNPQPWKDVMKPEEHEETAEITEGIRSQIKYNLDAKEILENLARDYFDILEALNNNLIPKGWRGEDFSRLQEILFQVDRAIKDKSMTQENIDLLIAEFKEITKKYSSSKPENLNN